MSLGWLFFFFFIIRPRRDRSSTPRRSRRRDSNLTVYTLRIHSLGNGPTQTKMICILLKCGFFSLRNRHTKSKSNSTIVLMVSAFPGNRYDYSSPYFTSLPYLDLKDRTGCYLMDWSALFFLLLCFELKIRAKDVSSFAHLQPIRPGQPTMNWRECGFGKTPDHVYIYCV